MDTESQESMVSGSELICSFRDKFCFQLKATSILLETQIPDLRPGLLNLNVGWQLGICMFFQCPPRKFCWSTRWRNPCFKIVVEKDPPR